MPATSQEPATSPEIGVPVAGVGVWSHRGYPELPRNVASQPAPETSATAAGTLFFGRSRQTRKTNWMIAAARIITSSAIKTMLVPHLMARPPRL
jgi:hypothetical protein